MIPVHEWFESRRNYAAMEQDVTPLGVRVANALEAENAPIRSRDAEEAQSWRLDAICTQASLARIFARGRSR